MARASISSGWTPERAGKYSYDQEEVRRQGALRRERREKPVWEMKSLRWPAQPSAARIRRCRSRCGPAGWKIAGGERGDVSLTTRSNVRHGVVML